MCTDQMKVLLITTASIGTTAELLPFLKHFIDVCQPHHRLRRNTARPLAIIVGHDAYKSRIGIVTVSRRRLVSCPLFLAYLPIPSLHHN
jgi:hypothetical protein